VCDCDAKKIKKEKDLNRNETHLFYSPKKSDTIFSDAVIASSA
jgi:hypothetical protein